MGFIIFLLVIGRYTWEFAFELVVIPFVLGIIQGVLIFILAGKFKNDGIAGLSEILTQLSSCLGLVFWFTFALILIISIYSLQRQCCRWRKDRQRGQSMVNLKGCGSSAEMWAGRESVVL